MKEFKCIALIPMKAHSERIAGKNFRDFSGKPLFRWIVDSLLNLNEIELIVINTDARDILRNYGIEGHERIMIRDRSPYLCGDLISMNRIIEDDINAVASDCYLMTHATNPLLKSRTIRSALEAYAKNKREGECDSLFTANKFHSRFYRSDGSAVNHDPATLIRTQDLPPLFEENSNLYIFNRESFQSTNARIGWKPLIFETPREESVDIDDQEGWNLAKALARAGAQEAS